MDQLKLAWVYRFWIVVGVVAVMPIVGYFIDTSSLAKSADAKARELEGIKTGLDAKLKGPFPNENWVNAVNEKKDLLDGQVGGAWIELYERQKPIKTFPKEVHDTFIQKGPKGDVDVATRLEYQKIFMNQYYDLIRSVDPVGLQGSKQLVILDADKVLLAKSPTWITAGFAPTVGEAWLAQEKIWILRAVMDVVRRANKDATSWNNAPVKRILTIDLFYGSEDKSARTKGANVKWDVPEEYMDPAIASTKDAQNKDSYRYLNKSKIYKPIPVRMLLHVDQRELARVLTEFGNSDIPMEVKEIEISQASEPPFTFKSKLAADKAKDKDAVEERGEALRVNDEFYNMTELVVHARAYLYAIPPKVEEQEKKAAAAKAAPAGTGAN